MTKNILITGSPGIGKTTILKKISSKLVHLTPVGFYTEEIRKENIRRGFELVGLDGTRGILSDVDFKTPFKVGKYRVDLKGFEDFLDKIDFFHSLVNLVIIDEIGKMECFSEKFKKLIIELLCSDKWLVATIALHGKGLIEDVKKRQDVKLIEVTLNNRDFLPSELSSLLEACLGYEVMKTFNNTQIPI